ncbi:MAG: hypothetical protein Q8O37_13090 [Sulfuricellaceae bacterium]|nr:hypothetical protein [Sulfuricellaceae bacterium]
MIVLRLALYLTAIGIGIALVLALLRRDRRYLRLAWQIFKFALILILVFAAIVLIGRIVLFRMPL